MLYSITLIQKKQSEKNEALPEIKKYIEEKEGKVLVINELGNANLKPRKKTVASTIIKLEIEVSPDLVEKIKNKIDHEKEIVSYILEKTKIEKRAKSEKEVKAKKSVKEQSSPRVKKEDANKAKKVLASMQEEEKKIKDLDSTLDKILNE